MENSHVDLKNGGLIGTNSNDPITPNTHKIDVDALLEYETKIFRPDLDLDYLKGKTVLVTGGGGSIGSELCRKLATLSVKTLIILDAYENNAYEISTELKQSHPTLALKTIVGSVCDVSLLERVFSDNKIDIIYHAAAHKHVPLMEHNISEAIKNNVVGTLNIVKAAKNNAELFVLISTDKAVNPTSVMGATKRCCEMIVQHYNTISKTSYVTVRFGNVLGSNGSVVPLFMRWIESGGPVRVTHKDISRYFMTIPDAASLVILAGNKHNDGEIFVLNMGDPIKIVDLAEKMIRLSGLEPYKDVGIEFVGLRSGEKLFEELLMKDETYSLTENGLIYAVKPISLEPDFTEKLESFLNCINASDDELRIRLKDIVPTYRIPNDTDK